MNPIGNILAPLIMPVIDKIASFIPNPAERQKAQLEAQAAIMAQQSKIVDALVQSDLAQIEVNKTEAASSSMFVAGWRPYVGWVCGFALSWQYVICPILSWGVVVLSSYMQVNVPAFPKLDLSELLPILFALLGMGGLRTLEKIRSVAREDDPTIAKK